MYASSAFTVTAPMADTVKPPSVGTVWGEVELWEPYENQPLEKPAMRRSAGTLDGTAAALELINLREAPAESFDAETTVVGAAGSVARAAGSVALRVWTGLPAGGMEVAAGAATDSGDVIGAGATVEDGAGLSWAQARDNTATIPAIRYTSVSLFQQFIIPPVRVNRPSQPEDHQENPAEPGAGVLALAFL